MSSLFELRCYVRLRTQPEDRAMYRIQNDIVTTFRRTIAFVVEEIELSLGRLNDNTTEHIESVNTSVQCNRNADTESAMIAREHK